jgi:cell division protein FtsW
MVAINEKPRRADFTLIVLALTLTCLGILLVFDASYAYALQRHISVYKYVSQQGVWAIVGVVVMAWASYRPYWRWRSIGVYGVIAAFFMLLAVFVPHIGIAAKGAHRWIGFGPVRIQPSEIAKVAIVLYIARVCAGKLKLMQDFTAGPLPPLFVVAFLALWTAVEPDLGTCLVILGTGLFTLYFAGMKREHVALAVAGLMICGGIFLAVKMLKHHSGDNSAGASFQLKRLTVFLHPDQDKQGDGYQIYHSTIALGTGGLLGMGIGEGREKMYLPEAHTDFIFAVLGEEGGLIASLFVLGLFGALVARGFHIAANTKDPYGALLAAGFSTAIGLQVFMNIGVVTASIPATGVPLPFISYGGSSLVLSLMMIGILINIARYPEGDPTKLAQQSERVADREFEMRWNRGQTLSRPEYRESLYNQPAPRTSPTGAPRGRR